MAFPSSCIYIRDVYSDDQILAILAKYTFQDIHDEFFDHLNLMNEVFWRILSEFNGI